MHLDHQHENLGFSISSQSSSISLVIMSGTYVYLELRIRTQHNLYVVFIMNYNVSQLILVVERACSSSCETVLFFDKQEGCHKANRSEGYKKRGTDEN